MKYSSIFPTAVTLASLSLLAVPATATEGGGNSYPIGVETNFSGMMLPEGLNTLVYFSSYSANDSKDNNGRNNTQLANFKLQSNTIAVRLSYVWPEVRFLGANVETRVTQALPSVDLSLGIARPAPLSPIDRSGSNSGLSDIAIAPVVLGWHSATLHQLAGVDAFLPTGPYDSSRPVNTGRNTYQVAPFYAMTWFPAQGVDVTAKFRYGIYSKNEATQYQSGNEFTAEFSAGYRPNPMVAFGLNGYVYRQTSDDTRNGAQVNGNGNRGSVNAIGPYVNFSFIPNFSLMVKLQSEFDAVNRPQGNRLWVQAKIPI